MIRSRAGRNVKTAGRFLTRDAPPAKNRASCGAHRRRERLSLLGRSALRARSGNKQKSLFPAALRMPPQERQKEQRENLLPTAAAKKVFLKKGLTIFALCDKIVPAIAELCNGSTADSDSVRLGSNPGSAAIKETQFVYQGKLRFLHPFDVKGWINSHFSSMINKKRSTNRDL